MVYSYGVVPNRATEISEQSIDDPLMLLGVRKSDLHLGIETEIKRFSRRYEEIVHKHVNVEVIQLLENAATVKRLKRM